MSEEEVIRVYVGADRSQLLAVSVLEHSIKRHTTANVEVFPMLDLPVPTPKDPANWQRTGFSFSRFHIPKLAGYQGKAIYMDADMQVFQDIRELWELPFEGSSVLVQKEVKHASLTAKKENAPETRQKQCSVMLLNCSELKWDVCDIINDLDNGKYTYQQLMGELCILPEDKVGYSIPFEWNSLEYFDADQTRLIHYTDMGTQPWASTKNGNGNVWFQELRDMLSQGAITFSQIIEEIKLGYFRPSLIRDIKLRNRVPKLLLPLFDFFNEVVDRLQGYRPHRNVYIEKRRRLKAMKEYENLNNSKKEC